MLSKNVISFDPKKIKKLSKWHPFFKAGAGILGLRLEENIGRSAQAALLEDFEFPFAIIYASDLFWSDIKKAAGYRRVAERILPFFCELHYYRYTGHFLIFIENNQKKNIDISLLHKELRQYGYTKVLIQVIDTSQDGSVSDRQLSSVISSSLFPKSNQIEWIISDSGTSDLYKSPAVHSQTEETILSLIEENYEYKEKTELLQKNITDLGFYYRALRGETAFKYRPDGHDKQIEITAPPQQEMIIENTTEPESFENTIINNVLPDIKTDYQRYYNENYERTPIYYKRLGHFLKLITGRRDFLYYMSKKHRQAFLDHLLLMPEDKRVQAWYYYEYEILPEWYKRVGKFLTKKTGDNSPL
jgi:hypothetical protein